MYDRHARFYEVGAGGSIDGNGKWIPDDEGSPIWSGLGDLQEAPIGRRRARLGENIDRGLFSFYFDSIETPIADILPDMMVLIGDQRYRVLDVDTLNNSVNLTRA